MDRLWAPWRSKFILAKKRKGCIFCLKNKKDKDLFIVKKSKFSFALLNIYPYNNGHIMVSPYRHVKDLNGLRDEELLDMMRLLRDMEGLLRERLNPQGFNIGINIQRPAGAGYVGHIHIHIVPRWVGDVNFITTLGDTKVIPQSLKQVHRLLTK